jgi:DNA-binding MarR family transcriptional regulator
MDDRSRLVASAVERLTAAGIRQHGALAKRLETTATDVLALHYVARGTGSTPGDLARALLLSPSGATAVVDRLSRVGLVSRSPGSGTRRVVLAATDAGHELHARTLGPLTENVGQLINALPGRDQAFLGEFLTRLADLAEQQADQLMARAEADARATAVVPPPVLWS